MLFFSVVHFIQWIVLSNRLRIIIKINLVEVTLINYTTTITFTLLLQTTINFEIKYILQTRNNTNFKKEFSSVVNW